MYATDNLVDSRLDTRRSVVSRAYPDSSVQHGVFRDGYERMLGQEELAQMAGKRNGYSLPRAPPVEYARKEEAGSYQFRRDLGMMPPRKSMDEIFASAYKVSRR